LVLASQPNKQWFKRRLPIGWLVAKPRPLPFYAAEFWAPLSVVHA
jgi:hypothetical protein